jgi:hypothetical protein
MFDVASCGQYGGKLRLLCQVGTFAYPEQSKIFLLTVKKSGLVTLTVQHDLIVGVIFM